MSQRPRSRSAYNPRLSSLSLSGSLDRESSTDTFPRLTSVPVPVPVPPPSAATQSAARYPSPGFGGHAPPDTSWVAIGHITLNQSIRHSGTAEPESEACLLGRWREVQDPDLLKINISPPGRFPSLPPPPYTPHSSVAPSLVPLHRFTPTLLFPPPRFTVDLIATPSALNTNPAGSSSGLPPYRATIMKLCGVAYNKGMKTLGTPCDTGPQGRTGTHLARSVPGIGDQGCQALDCPSGEGNSGRVPRQSRGYNGGGAYVALEFLAVNNAPVDPVEGQTVDGENIYQHYDRNKHLVEKLARMPWRNVRLSAPHGEPIEESISIEAIDGPGTSRCNSDTDESGRNRERPPTAQIQLVGAGRTPCTREEFDGEVEAVEIPKRKPGDAARTYDPSSMTPERVHAGNTPPPDEVSYWKRVLPRTKQEEAEHSSHS
ncbi:hypothetical protein B0H16DRAFT_1767346 [Mycena metata]|uniref:Uncharacterized protein n=1 Tax=Mycena metata TaxID=1033252 RepID=A0AAD7I3P1_9AGAR|nr:hypothetical protein B0H16DRAFT_1767346 [Mycena metata]